MSLADERSDDALDRLALAGGGFAMVAIDQRESLRAMLAKRAVAEVPDGDLTRFKIAAAEALAPIASALLLDAPYGLPALKRTREVNADCGIILAADRLEQESGGPVTDSSIDVNVSPGDARALGAAALKLLLIWTGESDRNDACVRTAREFMEVCWSAGLIGIIEGIVKTPISSRVVGWDREEELYAAAVAFGRCEPDIYKCEVPHYGRAEPGQIEEDCARITEALECPWVVLSSGVAAVDFPKSVLSACRGGASGFLAGRAIWADAAGSPDYHRLLTTESAARLKELAAIVEATARPWRDRVPD